LKTLRQFRIPIDDPKAFYLSVMVDGKVVSPLNDEVSLVNISSTGAEISSIHMVDLPQTFDLHVSFKQAHLYTKVRSVRRYSSSDENLTYFYGLEFVDLDTTSVQSFIKVILDDASSGRLKELMMEMIENEGQSIDAGDDLVISSKIAIDLFRSFQQYTNSNRLIQLFALEVQRTIKAATFRYYVFSNEYHDVTIWDFAGNKKGKNNYPIIGNIKKVKESGKIISSRLSHRMGDDPFYNLMQTLNDTRIDTYILCPVVDKSGAMIGIVEYTNKDDYELFNEDDRQEVALFSTVLGLALSMTAEIESYDYAKNLIDMVEQHQLIGVSEKNRYLNSFIDTCSNGQENVLVTGEFGVGKKSIAVNIHHKSENGQYGLGVINCHDISNHHSIDDLLFSSENHNGALELYSGGTIILQDVNYLKISLQEYLYSKIKDRSDIRFIATSSQNLETLELSRGMYPPLLNFLSEKNIRVPSLRERKDDIIPLMHFFTYTICKNNNIAQKNITLEIVNYFKAYDWPGNISELQVAIQRLVFLNQGKKTLTYNQTRVLPILDREVNNDVLVGVDFEANEVDIGDIDEDDFEELYFYFYVENVIQNLKIDFIDLPRFFDMEGQDFYEKVFHSNQLAMRYFQMTSESIENFLETKEAA
jgi:transcriptional regulator with AAA-type ATPase domain